MRWSAPLDLEALTRPRSSVRSLVHEIAASGSLLAPQEDSMSALLSVEDAAMELGTTVRFVRRLVHERRIRFHKIGKFVRFARGDQEAGVLQLPAGDA